MTTQLTTIADGVYGAETTFGIGLGTTLPLRMTVLRLSDGLALVAPIAIDDELASQIAAHGDVRYLIAPNQLHYAFLAAAKKRYPEARVLAAPGLDKKKPELPIEGALLDAEFPDLQTLPLEGAPKLSEVVLFHSPSRTLVVTDLVFNIRQARGMTRFVLKWVSKAFGRVEQSKLCHFMTKDRAAAGRSVEAILELPFERLVMAHGDVVDTGAKAALKAGTWWMRGETKRPETTAAAA